MLAWILNLELVYVLSGMLLGVFAVATLRDRANPRRYGTAAFWLVLGVLFALGSLLPYWLSGLLVIALVVLDGLDRFGHGDYREATHEEREAAALRYGHRLFLPVLLIPALTYLSTKLLAGTGIDANTLLYASLGLSSIVAAIVASAMTRATPRMLVDEGRRLADAIGPAVILPQLLASLGFLFTQAGVGRLVGATAAAIIPEGSLVAAVAVLCVSIAAFTFMLGNSFAAFPVIMAGIGAPLVIAPFGASPALVGAVAMTAASCGTLCTPMAANFNIVPPALFEMRDRYGVIKMQAPVAAVLLVVHIAALWALIRLGAFGP